MSFDLHSSFRTFVSFLYQVKDSVNSFKESVLNVFSSILIFSLIIFISPAITLFLKFTNLASFSILSRNNSFSSTVGNCR